ncbi:hypothetical protein T4E_5757 [Trichinella pseudospiralis]|uniref:Uncharacterized protein n=1 Tax=Trichinella pseudospiralis TaxID=6337 RepID=A0A0V0X4Z7_TRIPS|nr:hypothetical protein T4E_5757 [Trichinella pseudospiralis]
MDKNSYNTRNAQASTRQHTHTTQLLENLNLRVRRGYGSSDCGQTIIVDLICRRLKRYNPLAHYDLNAVSIISLKSSLSCPESQ